MLMEQAILPLNRWQDRVVIGDRVLDIPIDDDVVTEDKIRGMKQWIKENTDLYSTNYVIMYHGTARNNPILEQGILPTSKSNQKNTTSERGYVYLANTPNRAKMFGDLRNDSDSVVYEVIVPIRKLLPDKNILKSQYLPDFTIGNSLADSICFGGARVKVKIEPWQIKEYQPYENTPKTGVNTMKDGNMKTFSIPVTWEVWDKIEVEAETIEEAIKYVKDNLDDIPLGTDPQYIEDSYQIDDGEDGQLDVENTAKYLSDYWNLSGGITGEETQQEDNCER